MSIIVQGPALLGSRFLCYVVFHSDDNRYRVLNMSLSRPSPPWLPIQPLVKHAKMAPIKITT